MKLAFRPAASAADRTFVIGSWLDASRTSYSSGLIAMNDWSDVMGPQYEKAMSRPGMQSVVAYEADDPDFMYGFLVADPTEQRVKERDGSLRWWPALVLFVAVKQNFRREGVARKLFAHVGIDLSKPFLFGCNTQAASRLSHKVPHARFHPLVARFPKESPA
jgi:hypothetical protein